MVDLGIFNVLIGIAGIVLAMFVGVTLVDEFSVTVDNLLAPVSQSVSGTTAFSDAEDTAIGSGATGDKRWLVTEVDGQIAKDATITGISIETGSNVGNIDFKEAWIELWRKDGTTYDRIAITEDIADELAPFPSTIVTVTFDTPITGVQRGDFVGLKVNADPFLNEMIATSTGDGSIPGRETTNFDTTTNFNWDGQTITSSYIRAQLVGVPQSTLYDASNNLSANAGVVYALTATLIIILVLPLIRMVSSQKG